MVGRQILLEVTLSQACFLDCGRTGVRRVKWNRKIESGVLFCEDVEANNAEQANCGSGVGGCGDRADEWVPDRIR
jgi:hypothetical protein